MFTMYLWILLLTADAGTALYEVSTPRLKQNSRSLTVNWIKPQYHSTIYVPVTGYNVRYRLTVNGTSWSNPKAVNGPNTLATTIYNLVYGSTYEVQVRAVTTNGSREYSPSAIEKIYRAPCRVTGLRLSLVSVRENIRVDWNSPCSERPILRFEVQYRLRPYTKYGIAWHARWTNTILVQGPDSLTITVTNLIRRTYDVRVRATSDVGVGEYSATTTITRSGVPPQVTGMRLALVSGRGAVRVEWNKPSSERLITRYDVQYGQSPAQWSITKPVQGAYSLTTTLSNLKRRSYDVRVRAVSNSIIGFGDYSITEEITIIAAVPSAVTGVRLALEATSTQAGRSLRVYWNKPPCSMQPITRYELQYGLNPAYTNGWTNSTSVQLTNSLTTTLTGLERRTYDVRVRAVSEVGSGDYSTVATLNTAKVPAPVTGVKLSIVSSSSVSGQAAINVTWTKPSSDSTITQYEVQYGPSPAHSDGWTNTTSVQLTNSLTTTLTGLERRTYDVRVRAVSEVGSGNYSTVATLNTAKVRTVQTQAPVEDSTSHLDFQVGVIVGVFVAGLVAGVLGLLLVLGIVFGACKLMKQPKRKKCKESGSDSKALELAQHNPYDPDSPLDHIYEVVDEPTFGQQR